MRDRDEAINLLMDGSLELRVDVGGDQLELHLEIVHDDPPSQGLELRVYVMHDDKMEDKYSERRRVLQLFSAALQTEFPGIQLPLPRPEPNDTRMEGIIPPAPYNQQDEENNRALCEKLFAAYELTLRVLKMQKRNMAGKDNITMS